MKYHIPRIIIVVVVLYYLLPIVYSLRTVTMQSINTLTTKVQTLSAPKIEIEKYSINTDSIKIAAFRVKSIVDSLNLVNQFKKNKFEISKEFNPLTENYKLIQSQHKFETRLTEISNGLGYNLKLKNFGLNAKLY